MKVQVVYATPGRQFWVHVEVQPGATVRDAVVRSDVLRQFPEIDLEQQKFGIFGKIATLDAPLDDGDRVEIYRALIADPKQVKQRGKATPAAT
ncbi:RnfH family protein [uncultured Thiodictyon sp.]|uniref:RnfH family protein n=1 Tax=uncultured Thiodictyon sp. TaxID=1846217 RepID=UPI0025F4589D|nr:RnfH family protein [uncultured Thiodictyon sp.]